jgi:hypothetical protein
VTGKQRLQILHDRLLADTTHLLNMHWWMRLKEGQDRSYCGTTCCAFGFACTFPELIADGLSFSSEEHIVPLGPTKDTLLVPQFQEFLGHTAAKEFFELSNSEEQFIFEPFHYSIHPNKERVCSRIRTVLSNHS